MVFIEENLPSYYESKDKKNPLKEHQTPKFVTTESFLSPRSVGGQSIVLSKLGQSFNQHSSDHHKYQYGVDYGMPDEEIFFLIEKTNIVSSYERPKQRRLSDTQKESMSSQKQTTNDENPTAMIFDSLKRESYRNKNQCNIHKNAAKTIHRMLNTRILKQSLLGLH